MNQVLAPLHIQCLPRLKGYSPGLTEDSCDADRITDWTVVADDSDDDDDIDDEDDSVLGLATAESGKWGFDSAASK